MRRTMRVVILSALLVGVLSAADWPQWRGPKRDGHSGEMGVKAALTAKGGPKLAWTFRNAGAGLGTPAVVGERIYVMGTRKGVENVIALDLQGKELWATPIGPTWDFEGNAWSVGGPNCTPSVVGDRLYALTSAGVLACLDTTGGKEVWKLDLVAKLGAHVTQAGGGPETYGWGFSWSPLVDGDTLIITPGGKKGLFAALDRKTGNVLWQSAGVVDECTYASVMPAEIQGVKQYVAMTQQGVVAVDAKTGKELWYHKRDPMFKDMVCTTPLILGDRVLISADGAGTEVVAIEKQGANLVPKRVAFSRLLGNFHGGLVQVGDHVYGAHGIRDWKCVAIATGKVAWSTQEFGVGPLLAVGDVIVLQSQKDSELAVIEPDATAYKELSRWKLPETSKLRKSNTLLWTRPSAAGGKLFVRDQDLLFAYELK